MKYLYPFLVVLTTVSMTACMLRPAETKSPESLPKTVPAQGNIRKEPVAEAAIIGKPAPGSKFSKLRIGMPLGEVVALIGQPTKQWQHPTNKASIPYYFGPDRWAIKYSYAGEGLLTLNAGEEQSLTRIEVNLSE